MAKQTNRFSGRSTELTLFKTLLVEPHRTQRILAVSGLGGVGKSRLLEEYARIARSNGAIVCLVLGHQQQSPLAILREFGKQLRQVEVMTGDAFRQFFRSLERLSRIELHLGRKAGGVESTVGNLTSDAVAGGASAAIGTALGTAIAGPPGAIVGGVLSGALTPLLESATRNLLTSFSAQGIALSDAEFYQDPGPILAGELTRGINTLADRGSKFVLLFDTIERLGATLLWLRDCVLVPVCRDGVSIVLAGRYKTPRAEWLDLQAKTISVQLMPFSKQETREYLRENDVAVPEVQEFIYEQTRGLPLGLALWAYYAPQLLHVDNRRGVDSKAKEVEISETVVENIMRNLPDPELQTILRVAAVPRWFNAELLAILLGRTSADEEFAMLAAVDPLTKRTDRGLSLHDIVRESIGRTMQLHSPERFQTLHSACGSYFDRIRQSLARTVMYSAEWQDYTLEWVYHSLMLNMTTVFDAEIRAASRYYQHDFGTRLIADVESYLEQASSIAREHAYRKGCDLVYHNDFIGGIDIFRSILSDPTGHTRDQFDAFVLYRLGLANFWLGEYEEAIKYLNEAAPLFEHQKNMRMLSRVCIDLSRSHERLGDLPTAIEHRTRGCRYLRQLRRSEQPKEDRDYGFRLYAIGELFRLKSQYAAAIRLHSECLRNRQGLGNEFDIGESYIALAICNHAISATNSAMTFLSEASKLYLKTKDYYMLSDIQRLIGEIAISDGQAELARQSFQEAIDYGNRAQHRWSVRESENWLRRIA